LEGFVMDGLEVGGLGEDERRDDKGLAHAHLRHSQALTGTHTEG
jgi:hypothetical protein